MTDNPVELDEHRGMAAQKSTEIRRRLYEVQADQAALRRRQEEFERHALAAPSTTWAETAAKARYLILLFAETSEARYPATPRADRKGARRSCPLIRLNRAHVIENSKPSDTLRVLSDEALAIVRQE